MPPQHKVAEVIDFRNAMLGPRGYKMARKRTIEEREEQVNCCAVTYRNETKVLKASPYMLVDFQFLLARPVMLTLTLEEK